MLFRSKVARASTTGGHGEALLVFDRLFLNLSVAAVAIVTLIWMLAGHFLAWWVSVHFAEIAAPILKVLSLSLVFFVPTRGVLVPMVMGRGDPTAMTAAFLGIAVVKFIVAWIVAPQFGLSALAWCTSASLLIFSVLLLIREAPLLGWTRLRRYAFQFSLRTSVLVAAAILTNRLLDLPALGAQLGFAYAPAVLALLPFLVLTLALMQSNFMTLVQIRLRSWVRLFVR